MTRFGVMSHLEVLERAGLVTTQKVGREKLHHLNPVPIREVHDRWTGRFAAPIVGAMLAIRQQLEQEGRPMAGTPDHVYVTYIRATADAVWTAITDGAQTARYFYGTRVESTWQVGADFRYAYPDGSIAADGSVLAVEPGRSLVLSFQARWDPDLLAEGPVRMTWLIEPAGEGMSRLTVTHAGMGPKAQEQFIVGIPFIVAGLKSLLETGVALPQG